MYRTSIKLKINKDQYLVAHCLLEQIYTRIMESGDKPFTNDMILAEFAEKKISANAFRMWQNRPAGKLYSWQLPTSVAFALKNKIVNVNANIAFDDPSKVLIIGLGSKISMAL